LTLRTNGTVIIHTASLRTDDDKPFRVTLWHPRTKAERRTVERLIRKANETAYHGVAVNYCDCFDPVE
jgi:hypothetical protein